MPYYVYILKSISSEIFYKGYTTNYLKRLEQHNAGESRYTSQHGPWKLIYVEEYEDKKSALIREKQLKRVNKEYLQWLIDQPSNILNRKK